MRAASFLHDRNGAPYPALRLEIPQHQHRIAEIADIERRLHRAHQPMLRQDQDGDDPELIEGAQEFVHLEDKKTFLRHRVHVAVQAVNDDDPYALALDAFPHPVGEFSRRHLGWVDLLHPDPAGSHMGLEGRPRPAARANTVPSPSSNAKITTSSPRAAAAIA